MSIYKLLSGTNLSTWTTVVGDGNYNPPGVEPVNIADISCENEPDFSEVNANILKRQVMAHNITYIKDMDVEAMNCIHRARYKFQLPYVISTGNTDYNGQTVEGGLFVWDGADTQLDYGLAFQWVINPWDPNFKAIRYWDGTTWINLGTLEPDTSVHTIKFKLNMVNQTAYITLDGNTFSQNVFSSTVKIGWSSLIESRFQAEVISIYPGPTGPYLEQKVIFKNWRWKWVLATPTV